MGGKKGLNPVDAYRKEQKKKVSEGQLSYSMVI
jgi:hypothetical protein